MALGLGPVLRVLLEGEIRAVVEKEGFVRETHSRFLATNVIMVAGPIDFALPLNGKSLISI